MLVRNSLRLLTIVSCSVIPWGIGGMLAEVTNNPVIGVSVGLGTFAIGMFISLRLMKKWFC